MALARSIVRVAARAFVNPGTTAGGNPVTVFISPSSLNLPTKIQSDLARSCEWESVIAQVPSESGRQQGQNPALSFYMPSGEEVSFCAHAAMGAAAVIASEDTSGQGAAPTKNTHRTIDFVIADGTTQSASVSFNGETELLMETTLLESIVENFIVLDKLRTALGLRMEDVSLGGTGLPSYINSDVARPKTLFPMLDVNRLHSATSPKDPDKFRDLCDKIGSTGIYLYSPLGPEPNSSASSDNGKNAGEKQEEEGKQPPIVARYECRQFPRASGYPEDPATGIAAAALAASLRRRNVGPNGMAVDMDADASDVRNVDRYEFYQGTALGRRSRIGIHFGEEGSEEEGKVKIYVSGLVEILSRDEEEI